MEALKELIPLAVAASLALLVVAVGLDARISDLTCLLRKPGLLVRSLVSISVVVPVVAGVICWLAPLDPVVKAGMMAMAISPLPPLVPGKDLKIGADKDYTYGLYVLISLLAVVIVPVSLAIVSAVFPADASIAPAAVGKLVLTSVLIPLGVGMIVRWFAEGFATKAAPIVRKLAMALLIVAFVPILITSWGPMGRLIGDGAVLAMAPVAASGLLAGHLLGGPPREQRAALALASATRHPGLAGLIVTANAPELHANVAVLLFLLVSVVVAIPYTLWLKRSAPISPVPS